jgi:hypothetical protein
MHSGINGGAEAAIGLGLNTRRPLMFERSPA